MFKVFGPLKKVLRPPAGIIAIVDYGEGNEKNAGNAWKTLAYKRLKDSLLYLEWAPQGLLDGPDGPGHQQTASSPQSSSKLRPALVPKDKLPQQPQNKDSMKDNDKEEDIGDQVPPGATLYIGNLSFATTSARLSSLFRHLPSFAFAKVVTKSDPTRSGPAQTLSQGYGFIGFKTVEAAKAAMKGFAQKDGLVLDGHILKISFAGRGREDAEHGNGNSGGGGAGIGGTSGKAGGSKGTKLIVKNLAFEVSKKELWELFRQVYIGFIMRYIYLTATLLQTVHTVKSSQSVFPIERTAAPVDLLLWTLPLARKRRMRGRSCSTHTCSDDI